MIGKVSVVFFLEFHTVNMFAFRATSTTTVSAMMSRCEFGFPALSLVVQYTLLTLDFRKRAKHSLAGCL
jgi:hypothetical protein